MYSNKCENELIRIVQLIIILCCTYSITFAQDENYGFETWPGKNGVIKSNIVFPDQLISNYDLTLAKGSNGTQFFYKIPLNKYDSIKEGRLQVQVFTKTNEAQLALVEYLDCLTTIITPPRLTSEVFKAGDVAFGEHNDGVVQMAFTKNNVIVIVHALIEEAIEIVQEIDRQIQLAQEWENDNTQPMFVLTK